MSFTRVSGKIIYRLCAVATVAHKLDHRFIMEEQTLKGKEYINVLIKHDPRRERWVHSEGDRRIGARHQDWLWRIADHNGTDQKRFEHELSEVYDQGWFSNATTMSGNPLRMAGNYVVLADDFVAQNPPAVAQATQGSHETWTNQTLRDAIFRTAPSGTRTNIRTNNPSIAHPHIRWTLAIDRAVEWKAALIREMQNSDA